MAEHATDFCRLPLPLPFAAAYSADIWRPVAKSERIRPWICKCECTINVNPIQRLRFLLLTMLRRLPCDCLRTPPDILDVLKKHSGRRALALSLFFMTGIFLQAHVFACAHNFPPIIIICCRRVDTLLKYSNISTYPVYRGQDINFLLKPVILKGSIMIFQFFAARLTTFNSSVLDELESNGDATNIWKLAGLNEKLQKL